MAEATLSRDDIALGRAVLLATDSLGLSAEGAFWLYDKEDSQWRYFLVTSLLQQIGARELFLRINDAIEKKLSENEAKGFSYFLADPKERLVMSLRKEGETTPYTSEPILTKANYKGHQV